MGLSVFMGLSMCCICVAQIGHLEEPVFSDCGPAASQDRVIKGSLQVICSNKIWCTLEEWTLFTSLHVYTYWSLELHKLMLVFKDFSCCPWYKCIPFLLKSAFVAVWIKQTLVKSNCLCLQRKGLCCDVQNQFIFELQLFVYAPLCFPASQPDIFHGLMASLCDAETRQLICEIPHHLPGVLFNKMWGRTAIDKETPTRERDQMHGPDPVLGSGGSGQGGIRSRRNGK